MHLRTSRFAFAALPGALVAPAGLAGQGASPAPSDSTGKKPDPARAPVGLKTLAEDVARELGETAPGRSAEFLTHRGSRATGDPALLRAVVTNLLENAWKKEPECWS